MNILLASNSPRRKELLQNLGFAFEVVSIECDEIYPEDLATEKIAEYLSELKADSYGSIKQNEVLITADTVVAMENEILGKPKDETQAREMLRKLSGKTHYVYTGFTVKNRDKIISKTDVAAVTMNEISEEETDFYIKNYKPFDKAGSYGVQEWLGMAKIAKIEGSYYTIMGLPTHLIYAVLKDFE